MNLILNYPNQWRLKPMISNTQQKVLIGIEEILDGIRSRIERVDVFSAFAGGEPVRQGSGPGKN